MVETTALSYEVARHAHNLPDVDHLVIQVNHPGEPKCTCANSHTVLALSLELDDITVSPTPVVEELLGRAPVPANRAALRHVAEEVIRLVPDECQRVVVVCPAGLSRSAAIAAAIEDFFGGCSKKYMPGKGYFPNPLVYTEFLEALRSVEKG